LDKKLDLLKVRTDNAIASLVRERIDGARKAARPKDSATESAEGQGEEMGMEGVALVEGVRVREREELEKWEREEEVV
jgi:coiled-coil domain-containing protein 12